MYTYVYTHIYKNKCMYLHINTYIYIYSSIHVFKHMYLYMYSCKYIHICTYMHAYTCMNMSNRNTWQCSHQQSGTQNQCVAVCCSVLQCVVVCYSADLHAKSPITSTNSHSIYVKHAHVHACIYLHQYIYLVYTALLPTVEWHAKSVCCSVVQRGAVWCSVVQHGAGWCSVVQCGAAWCSVVQCGAV